MCIKRLRYYSHDSPADRLEVCFLWDTVALMHIRHDIWFCWQGGFTAIVSTVRLSIPHRLKKSYQKSSCKAPPDKWNLFPFSPQISGIFAMAAFCGGERPLVRSQRPGYFKGFPVSMVKAKAGAYAPHWHQNPFEINGFQADLSVGLLDLHCILGVAVHAPHSGRLAPHQWPLVTAVCRKGVLQGKLVQHSENKPPLGRYFWISDTS